MSKRINLSNLLPLPNQSLLLSDAFSVMALLGSWVVSPFYLMSIDTDVHTSNLLLRTTTVQTTCWPTSILMTAVGLQSSLTTTTLRGIWLSDCAADYNLTTTYWLNSTTSATWLVLTLTNLNLRITRTLTTECHTSIYIYRQVNIRVDGMLGRH